MPCELIEPDTDILAVCFTREQLDKLIDVLDGHEDRGPRGEGWQSEELETIVKSLRQQAANLGDDACFSSS